MNALKIYRVATSLLACCLYPCSVAAPNLKMEIFAGIGSGGSAGDNGPATQAQLNGPTGIARTSDGSLYICDTENHRVRRVTFDKVITTVAGTGERGWSGDGDLATRAKLNEPYEVRFDKSGNVFWVERMNHLVRKLDPRTGRIATVAGSGVPGFSGDGGPASGARLNEPHSIGFDNRDDLYICDVKNHRIRKVEMRTGVISTFAGTGEGKPTPDNSPIVGTPLHGPRALDFDRAGSLWLALREGNMILKLDLAKGLIHRVAGTGKKGFTGNNGPATQATLAGPKGLSVGPNGNVYFTDTENHAVRMIDTKSGKLLLIAGTGIKGTAFDSDPLKCTLARPHGIFVATDGSIFIGDTEAHRIEFIHPTP